MNRVELTEFAPAAEPIFSIRFKVFVEEQNVNPELEVDGLDPLCLHALAYDGETPVGTGRLQNDGHIGRMAVLKSHRGHGIGSEILKSLIDAARSRNCKSVWLASQTQATAFYERFGFQATGDIFQDAGIDHIEMRRDL